MKKLFILLLICIGLYGIGVHFKLLPDITKQASSLLPHSKEQTEPIEKQKIISEESVITNVIEKSIPSVVTVGIKKTIPQGNSYYVNPFDPFGSFEQVPGTQKETEQNIGSGFIVSPDGLIITNRHVVADTDASYTVITNDKKTYQVEKIYRDPLNDLAILKISATGLKPLPLGDSSNLKLGQIVVAIGTPLGEFTNTVTDGIISGLGRGITAGSPLEGYVEKLDNVIQTNAAINHGNSGGPLLNSQGQVIGINTAVAEDGQNIGFAIPANVIQTVIDTFKKNGSTFERPYIGVRYKTVDRETAVVNKLAQGAYIIQVLPGSPAEKAGLQDEDIIMEFDGKPIVSDGSDQEIPKALQGKKVEDTVKLKIWRNGQTMEKTVTLEAAR